MRWTWPEPSELLRNPPPWLDRSTRRRNAVPAPGFRPADLVGEVTTALTARPARTMLTALGTILGVAALVATLGLAKTAGNQIVRQFDELEATRVVLSNAERQGRNETQLSAIPFDAEDRLTRLNGVEAAGTKTPVDVGGGLARSVPLIDPQGQNEFQIPVIAASPGLFDAVRATVRTGRFFDTGHDERSDAVAVLGPGAANRLGVERIDNLPAIFVGEEAFAVVGILDDVARETDLLNSIIIPNGLARDRFQLAGIDEVHVDVAVGAADLIGAQAPIALSPNEPGFVRARVPPSPRAVRSTVESEVNALFLVLGGLSLLVGAIGIANVTLVSVLERTGEIGLRRALGATRGHIAGQFLTESAALGLFAGVLGASLGILSVVGVSAARQWTPVLEPWLPFAAPVLGAIIGLVAGVYPAWKASSIEPITALRVGAG